MDEILKELDQIQKDIENSKKEIEETNREIVVAENAKIKAEERYDEAEKEYGANTVDDYEREVLKELKDKVKESKLNEKKTKEKIGIINKKIKNYNEKLKYMATDKNIITINKEISKIDKEIEKKKLSLQKVSIELSEYSLEEDKKGKIPQDFYNEQDKIKKEISELNNKKDKYQKILETFKLNREELIKEGKYIEANKEKEKPIDGIDYERARRFKELMASGMTQEEAKNQVDKELPFDRINKPENYNDKRAERFKELIASGMTQEEAMKQLEKELPDKDKPENYNNKRAERFKELIASGMTQEEAMKQLDKELPDKDKPENYNDKRAERFKELIASGMTQEEAMKQLEKEFPDKDSNKVIFNIRTGEYTYLGKDGKQYKLPLKSKYLKGNSKDELLNEILDNHEMDPMDPKDIDKIDIHLYQMLKYIDSIEHTSKANDYIEAFLDEDPKKMPIDLVYDLKNRSKENEEVKKLKFADKMRIKSIARRHEKLGLAECIKDKTLFKKILLGLGIAGASTAIAIGAGSTINKNTEDLVNMEASNNVSNDKDQTLTPTPVQEDLVQIYEQSGKPVNQNTNEQTENNQNLNEQTENNQKTISTQNEKNSEDLAKQLKDFMSQFKGTNYVSVNEGLEYTNASDMNQIKGKFAEDMDCKISNRAIVQKLEDGSEKIVATAKGKTWEEAGIDVSKYNSSDYVEKYALEAIEGRKDSRGYSTFGWVNADDCEKIYKLTQEENGKTVTTYHTKENIKDMAREKFSLSKHTARTLTSDSKTVDDEQER